MAVAAFLFALTTVFAKLAFEALPALSAIQVALFRFLVGFAGMALWTLWKKPNLKPVAPKWVLLRAVFNAIAVIFFFLAVEFTSITNANMLNMTSPVWIFMLAPLYYPTARRSPMGLIFLVLTVLGSYMVVVPDFSQIRLGDLYGLASGFVAGFAITYLHKAREQDRTFTILFYQFGLGSLLLGLLVIPAFTLAGGLRVWSWVLLSGALGFVGQHLLTLGYRYVDTRTGSLISASQILYATLLGVLLFEEQFTWRMALGGVCILIALVGVSGAWQWLVLKRKKATNPYL